MVSSTTPSVATPTGRLLQQPTTRDPLLWPFTQDSIWNTPLGDGAVYVPARIRRAQERGMTIDEDILVLDNDSETPLTPIYYSNVGWAPNASQRCDVYDADRLLYQVPIPYDFVVSPDTWDGLRPNSGLAVLVDDNYTIVQTQPFARCQPGGIGTTLLSNVPTQNLRTDQGIRGAHGGSGLSAIGGTLRVGELVPGGVIQHALKVNLFGRYNLYRGSTGYRWPAVKADSGFDDPDAGNYYNGTNPALQMGSLLALHPSEDLSSSEGNSLGLETEAALILARALQDYGAYVVDNTAWDVYALVTEWGPGGRRVNEEVEMHWGHAIKERSKDTPFANDMDRIFLNLYVVDNNGPESVGGGGNPRVPLAPPFFMDVEEDNDAESGADGGGGLFFIVSEILGALIAAFFSVFSS